jgi:hypothetical protein
MGSRRSGTHLIRLRSIAYGFPQSLALAEIEAIVAEIEKEKEQGTL